MNYNDIIPLPHHVSETRPRMSRLGRAAQFSPFAALTGFDEIIGETGRETLARAELSEDGQARINEQLNLLLESIAEQPEAEITFFVPDESKAGGEYKTTVGNVKRVDEYERALVLTDDRRIFFENIYELQIRG